MRPIDADNLISLVTDDVLLTDGFKQAFCALVNSEPTIDPKPDAAEILKPRWITTRNNHGRLETTFRGGLSEILDDIQLCAEEGNEHE